MTYNDDQPMQSIPELTGEDPRGEEGYHKASLDINGKPGQAKRVESLQSPQLPEAYNNLSRISLKKTLSKNKVYSMIEKFTPYLVQNLLYLGANPHVPPATRVRANQILLNKILPDLSAEHIKLEGDNLQSLVIVKANKVKSSNDIKHDDTSSDVVED